MNLESFAGNLRDLNNMAKPIMGKGNEAHTGLRESKINFSKGPVRVKLEGLEGVGVMIKGECFTQLIVSEIERAHAY